MANPLTTLLKGIKRPWQVGALKHVHGRASWAWKGLSWVPAASIHRPSSAVPYGKLIAPRQHCLSWLQQYAGIACDFGLMPVLLRSPTFVYVVAFGLHGTKVLSQQGECRGQGLTTSVVLGTGFITPWLSCWYPHSTPWSRGRAWHPLRALGH